MLGVHGRGVYMGGEGSCMVRPCMAGGMHDGGTRMVVGMRGHVWPEKCAWPESHCNRQYASY